MSFLLELRSMIRSEFSNGSDIPTTPTSSVGEVVYPPVPASENRKKGIFPSVITLPGDLLHVANEFQGFPLDADTTRISVRYFVENNALNQLSRDERAAIAPSLEGIVKLAGDGDAFQDCSIVYLGKNASTRRTDPNVFNQEVQMAQDIFNSEPARQQYDYSGFSFREITPTDKIDPRIIDQYAQLYSAFGWTPQEVQKIVQNPTNILLGAFVGDHLVSAGMAERAEFSILRNGEPQPFVMYEVTEAATQYDYRGRGLYTKIATELMKILAQTDTDMLYGESNLGSEAIIRTAHSLGRTSSMETLREFGFPPRILEQHVRISGGANDVRPPEIKNDLLPTYMTRHKLLEYAHGQ